MPGKECQKALLTLDSVVNYYTSCGNPVFVAFLDATKVFNKVNHYDLIVYIFLKIKIGVTFASFQSMIT